MIRGYGTKKEGLLLYPTSTYSYNSGYLNDFKPEEHDFVEKNARPVEKDDKIGIKYYARVEKVIEGNPQLVEKINNYYIWTKEHVHEFVKDKDFYIWILRVYKFKETYFAEKRGGITYSNLNEDISLNDMEPVLSDEEFNEFLREMDVVEPEDELTVVEDKSEIEKAQELFLELMKNVPNQVFNSKTNEGTSPNIWFEKLELGMISRKIEFEIPRYLNEFGIEKPEEGKNYSIVCGINIPVEGINRNTNGVFAKGTNGEYYILHRFNFGGYGFKKEDFEEYEGNWKVVQDGKKKTRMVLVGKLDDNLPYNVKEFVNDVHTLKLKGYGSSFYNYLINKGYFFDKQTIENYLLSLKVKPFVILTGNSGTGKTKLAQLFAQFVSTKKQNKILETDIKVGQSAKSRTWALKRDDVASIIPYSEYEGKGKFKVDDIEVDGKLYLSPRIVYNSEDKIVSKLEKLEQEDPNQKIKLEIELHESTETQYKIVPVGANWTENRHIVGFYNVISDQYQETPAFELIKESEKNKEIPHFLILDEMNLSHVERYFADFLSALESGESIPLYTEKKNSVESELKIPENLLVIGTVNVDETTYMFSPKVLDRANTIEFSTYSAKNYMNNDFDLKAPSGNLEYLENPLLDSKIRESNINGLRKILEKVSTLSGQNIWDVLSNELESFQDILKEAGFDFGFRVINEILRFMCVAWTYEGKPETWNNWERYFDAQIKQKMLPKIHGSERAIGNVLLELFNQCLSIDNEKSPRFYDLSNLDNIKFISSAIKLQEMDKVLAEQRYVSFIN